MFRCLFKTMKIMCWLCWVMIYSYIFLLMNVFTIPFFLLAWVFCKLLKLQTPKVGRYSLMFYPKWTGTVNGMTGLEFERYCADYLRKKGFKNVTVTPASGDYGADLVAYDKKGDRWVFQCKHYQNKVGNDAVQEVVAAKAHYNAAKAGVITNSRLTDKAKELALENDIFLYEMING